MTQASRKVVYAALAGNVLVAASKFVAGALSGSSAMLTEAIHSTADCANQGLLLLGGHRSEAEPDDSHAFGYGLELYFWTFVVAIVVMLAGGGFSLWEGWRHLVAPEPIRSPALSFGVLVLSAVFEGWSLTVGLREFRRQVRGRRLDGERIGLWRFIVLSKDPNLYESLLEDSAALIGIALAGIGVACSVFGGWLRADGAASMAIGLLLVADSLVIASATRSLIAGEAVTPPVMLDLRRALEREDPALPAIDIKTLHLGPERILVAVTLDASSPQCSRVEPRVFEQLTDRLRAVDARIGPVYFAFRNGDRKRRAPAGDA